jgi:hypothetical protein
VQFAGARGWSDKIARVRPGVSSGQREGYAAALSDLWQRVAVAVSELEAIAADPEFRLDDEAVHALPELQYALHAGAELAVGIEPPAGAEAAHAELAAALAGARDATAEVAEASEDGGFYAAEPLIPEWRGALFRVRLARLRLAAPSPMPRELAWAEEEPPSTRGAFPATLFVIAGAAAFAGGATMDLWPLWAVGLALVAGALLVYRPRA